MRRHIPKLVRDQAGACDTGEQTHPDTWRKQSNAKAQYIRGSVGVRISSLHRKAADAGVSLDTPADLGLLDAEELALVKMAAQYARVVEGAAMAHEPHRIAFYLYDLAAEFHALWNRGNDDPSRRFLLENNPQLSRARLELARGIGQIIRNGLKIMGVEAVEEMR